jgi:hypothetical protein
MPSPQLSVLSSRHRLFLQTSTVCVTPVGGNWLGKRYSGLANTTSASF